MDFEQWKGRRQFDGDSMVSLRGMKGWEEESSRHKVMYFPEDLVSFVESAFLNAEICDLYYNISESEDQSYCLETLTLELTVGDRYIDSNLYLEMNEGDISLTFTHTVDHSLEVTNDTEKILCVLYNQMKQFIEENSPQRLVLLSSDVSEWLPEWMVKG